MSWIEILLFVATLLVMLVGLAGIALPILPGIPIIFAAAFVYALLTDFASVNGQTLLVFGLLTLVALVLDWAASAIGMKRMGGSFAGMVGAFLGMIIGLLSPGVGIAGFVIGAFAGAYVMELLINKDSRIAMKAGLGSFIGFLAGTLMKFVIGLVMIGLFIRQVLHG